MRDDCLTSEFVTLQRLCNISYSVQTHGEPEVEHCEIGIKNV
jgi:hypothetical protein